MLIARAMGRIKAWVAAAALAAGFALAGAPASAQPESLTTIDLSKPHSSPALLEGAEAEAARVKWWSAMETCSEANRSACNRAVALAKTLFERTDKNVATTWMKACLAGDQDRCEIGYRRFRSTSFPDDDKPIAHLFARASCYRGMYDLCRPWDDFDTTDEDKRALVMAKVCLEGKGASMNTCHRALAHFRHKSGLFSAVTNDLATYLCKRNSTSACRVYAESVEAHWDPDRAYRLHKQICERGLQESCVDAKRLKRGVDYRRRKKQEAREMQVRRQQAQERARSYRPILAQRGYTYTPGYKKEATPFGSSPRDRENWRRYQYNTCRGNPVNKYC